MLMTGLASLHKIKMKKERRMKMERKRKEKELQPEQPHAWHLAWRLKGS